jgi:ribose 5-phosphate isomerase B
MRIAMGSDHAGFILKESLRQHLESRGIDVKDCGTFDRESVDYPDFASEVTAAVTSGDCAYGILVCSTGIGMCVAANKVKGIRAALAYNPEAAVQSRAHVDCNVIVFGEKYTDPDSAVISLDRWLETPFEGGRHERRVNKIKQIEG